MRVMDIKPTPTTEIGIHNRWVNHMVGLGQLLNPRRKEIPVEFDPADSEADQIERELAAFEAQRNDPDNLAQDRYERDHDC